MITTLTYLRNQQARMKYDAYRRQGLPITSAYIESTIKQINRRVKGSEKFWNQRGGAPPGSRVLVANRSAQLMELAAELLSRLCRNVLVTDLCWPTYLRTLRRRVRQGA